MQVKTISATYGRKFNLGDFNSAHVEMSVFADLEDGDDEAACATALRDMARNHVITEGARFFPQLEAKVENIIMGLPVELQGQLQPVEEVTHAD